MSKLEEALRMAGSGQGQARKAPAARVETSNPKRQLKTLPSHHVSNTGHALSRVPEASKQIKLMAESKLFTDAELDARRIVFPNMRNRKLVNTFRQLRTNLQKKGAGRNATIMVTPVTTGSGGSFVAYNLASSFSFDEAKTALLVDCNLDAPSQHVFQQAEDSAGLVEYLYSEDMDESNIIQPTGIPRLRWIAAGNTEGVSNEILGSGRMHGLLARLKERYEDRFIVVDAPPVAETADAAILADFCDYVLLVVPYGKVTERKIRQAVKAIGKAKLLGVVLNDDPGYFTV